MQNQSISTVLMSETEARECITAIKATFLTARDQVNTLDEGEGWRALGYDSLILCLTTELSIAKSQAYVLTTAAATEKRISTSGGKPSKPVSNKAYVELSKIPEDAQRTVLDRTVIQQPTVTAGGIRRNWNAVQGPISKGDSASGSWRKADKTKHCPTCSC